MGQELRCTARHDGRSSAGRLLLETDELIFRGEFRLVVPYRSVSRVHAHDGVLELAFGDETAEFDLGDVAERAAKRIANPKGRLDKLGVKAGQRVAVLGVADEDFRAELAARARLVDGEDGAPLDHLFAAVESSDDLDRLAELRGRIAPDGAVWTVRRKGRKDLTEGDVMAAGKRAGLVDVKVVRFSATDTAEKLVIPVASR